MIKIPINNAIALLEKRQSDLNDESVDLDAWKSRVLIDLRGIYGMGASEIISIIGMTTSDYGSRSELLSIKKRFHQTLQGYVESIRDFSKINKQQIKASEEEFKLKYNDLLLKWNGLVPEYNKLLTDYESLHKNNDELISEISMLRSKSNNTIATSEKIKILFLGAGPLNEVRLRSDEEIRDIEIGLKLTTLRDNFELKQKWAVTTQSLQQAMLEEKPNIVHFSGHGSTNGIALEDVLGNAKLISNDAIGSLFELFSSNINCVFLNSCYSESQAKEIAKHVPFVVGMKMSVPDKAAIAFSVGFYTALGAGKDIEFAFKMGIVSIKLEGISGSEIPVLLN